MASDGGFGDAPFNGFPHLRHDLIVRNAGFFTVDGFLHLALKPSVIAVCLLLSLELGHKWVKGGCGMHGIRLDQPGGCCQLGLFVGFPAPPGNGAVSDFDLYGANGR